LVGAAALVEWQHRYVRNFLGRIQFAANGDAASPALKAILALHATVELFHNDVRYMNGIAHIDEFELNMDLAEGWTGAPDYSLDESVLGPRFDAAPWSLLYLKHERDGPLWGDFPFQIALSSNYET
jgi:hypothetical protein